MNAHTHCTVAVIGGGVVGTAIAFTLAHRGIETVLLEADDDLAYAASGTNSGIVHTGFDSTPGALETEMILRAGRLRPAVLDALGVPVRRLGAVLRPHRDEDHDTIRSLADNAARNGVEATIRDGDGALLVPGESIVDPVAFTLAMAASTRLAGARIRTRAKVVALDTTTDGLRIGTADGHVLTAEVAINAAGLHADEVARLLGDDSFEIYPRKGEFFVFEPPADQALTEILLPVPTKRTKGVLVFPTLDGRVVAGPTAHDQEDKGDWSVRPEAGEEVLDKARGQYPALERLEPIATYAGLRPAGRGSNYVIGPSGADPRLINVAAIRSTGLTAALGIADYVLELLPAAGITVGEQREISPLDETPRLEQPWWRRTADRLGMHGTTS